MSLKQNKLAQDFLKGKGYNDYNQRMKIIGSLKHDIPNLRLDKGKFVLAALRMYLDDRSLNDEQSIRSLDNVLKYIHAGNHTNEYDENLNGLSLQELSNMFREISKQQSADDRERSNNRQFGNGNGYTIIPINNYQEAKKYGQYTSWCVTHGNDAFDSYTQGGNRFYFCLKQGFEQLKPVVGDGCPLDEYGLSMIAVNIDYEGNLTRVTTRWNHEYNGENNPNLETPEQLENVLGVPFYKTFKPYTRDELHKMGIIMFDEIQELLDNGKKPEEIFEWVSKFSNGFTCVKLNGKYSFIDKTNKLINDGNLWFDEFFNFYDGFAVVKLNNKFSFIDKNCKLIGDGNLWFDVAGAFSEGFAVVKLNNKFSFIDKNCKLIGDGNLWFDKAYSFQEGFAIVLLNGKWSFIDKNFKFIGDGNLWFDYVNDFYGGFAHVKLNNKWSLIDTTGKLIGDGNLWFDKTYSFQEGFSLVLLNGKYSFIDTTGKLIGDGNLWFDEANSFNEGFASVQLNGKYSFIDKNGKLIGDGNLWFDYAYGFSNGFARVSLNDKWSFIDKNGKLIDNGNLWFDWVLDFQDGFAEVILNDKWYKLRNDSVLCDEYTKKPINQPINESLRKSLDLMKRMK